MDIPTQNVIEHWVGWGSDGDFSHERVEQFRAWLKQERIDVWEEGAADGCMWHHPDAENPYLEG
ncbi:MAG TPA: hypothetical protein VFM18_04510 [Methanosarcina sp.]|nr:hypothetical protein [Methanosarcina sp.]